MGALAMVTPATPLPRHAAQDFDAVEVDVVDDLVDGGTPTVVPISSHRFFIRALGAASLNPPRDPDRITQLTMRRLTYAEDMSVPKFRLRVVEESAPIGLRCVAKTVVSNNAVKRRSALWMFQTSE